MLPWVICFFVNYFILLFTLKERQALDIAFAHTAVHNSPMYSYCLTLFPSYYEKDTLSNILKDE